MIPEDATFEKYLNHYDVIYLDITLQELITKKQRKNIPVKQKRLFFNQAFMEEENHAISSFIRPAPRQACE